MSKLLKRTFVVLLSAVFSVTGAMAQSKVIHFDPSVYKDMPNVIDMGITIPDTTVFTPEELREIEADPTGFQEKPGMKKARKKAAPVRHWCSFTYITTDAQDKYVEISAKISWKSTEIEHVILYCPYTHCANSECATEDTGVMAMEEIFYNSGNLIITTDGEGFGKTKNRTQMYLNHEVWAVQEVDCLKTAMALVRDWKNVEDKPQLKDGWDTVIAGTSQGGGTALATLRYMEEKDLCDKYNVSFCNVCCGPYDPTLTFKSYVESWYRLTYPCVIPMVIKSYMESYPDVFEGYKEDDFYAEPYLAIKSQVDAALESKDNDADAVNKIFFNNLACTSKPVDLFDGNSAVYVTEIFRPEIIDGSSDLIKKFMKCLERNNVLRDGWTPKHWVKIAYSDEDAVVPYENTKKLISQLKTDNYSTCDISDVGHVKACANWIMSTTWADKNY